VNTRRQAILGSLLLLVGAAVLLVPLGFAAHNEWRYHREMAAAEEALSPLVLSPIGPPGPGSVAEPPLVPPLTAGPIDLVEPVLPEKLEPIRIDRSKGVPVYELEIPKLDLRYKVGEGTANSVLARGPGHYERTVLPGEGGNAALAAHRTIRGKPAFFYAIDQLEPGDLLRINYADTTLTFHVERLFFTSAYDLSVLDPTPYPSLTLTTCDPPGTDERRLIVQARLAEITESTGAH